MGKDREEYEKLLDQLKNSYTEEDIIENLTLIVKGFSVHFYKSDLTQNPFYKSLLVDIKEEVLGDLYEIKKSVLNEITDCFILASFALLRDVFKLARTTEAKSPMIATTTKSSIKVNPVFLYLTITLIM